MVCIKTSTVFEFCELVLNHSKEELEDNELFLYFCDLNLRGESFVMELTDIDPEPNAIDWFALSFEQFNNFKLDQMNGCIIFYNMDSLMYGMQELYNYIDNNYANVETIHANSLLISKCLAKILQCLNVEELMSQVDDLGLN